jgi:hypothetical protein
MLAGAYFLQIPRAAASTLLSLHFFEPGRFIFVVHAADLSTDLARSIDSLCPTSINVTWRITRCV